MNKPEHGFVAIMSAVVISIILMTVMLGASMSSFYARFDALGKEQKRISLSLAESCMNVALLRLAQNAYYAPETGGDIVAVGGDRCRIVSVSTSSVVFPRTLLVKTQAAYRGSFSNIETRLIVPDPVSSPYARSTLFVVTHVINDNGGTSTPADFILALSAGNPSISTFEGSTQGVIATIDPGVSYDVTTQFGPSGYLFSTDCTGTPLALGSSKTCVVTYDDDPTMVTLAVKVNVKNNNGGKKLPSDFVLRVDGIRITEGIPLYLTPGTHTVSAVTPSGYTASSWGYNCAANGNVDLPNPGMNKTCQITFDDIAPPAPSCADTVVLFDRTANADASEREAEQVAATSLLRRYGTLSLRPRFAVGSFGGLDGSPAEIPPEGQLTSFYGDEGVPTSTPNKFPGVTFTSGEWANATNAHADDALFTTSRSGGDHLVLGDFNLSIPVVGSVVSGIEVVTDGMVEGVIPSASTTPLLTVSNGDHAAWKPNLGTTLTAIAANDSDTFYIATSSGISTFVFEGAGVPVDAEINSVTLTAVARSTGSGGATLNLIVEEGVGGSGKLDIGATSTLPSAYYSSYGRTMTRNPFTNAKWTPAEVNQWTTRFGIHTDSSGVAARVTQLFVTVHYDPPQAGTVEVSLSNDFGSNWSVGKSAPLRRNVSTTSLGGLADLWETAWTPADISNAAFLLKVTNTTAAGMVSLNYVKVRVFYTPPTTGLYREINIINTSSPTSGTDTDLGRALHVADMELSSSRHLSENPKAIIFVTNGLPNLPTASPEGNRDATLNAADVAKGNGVEIYGVHYGDEDGRNLLASTSDGTFVVTGHEPGSQNNAGLSTDDQDIEKENTDADHFFIATSSRSMKSIFDIIGSMACPALVATATTPPTKATLMVSTHVVNDNGGVGQSRDFTMGLSGSPSLSFSINHFSGASSPGVKVIMNPGHFVVDEEGYIGSYTRLIGVGCDDTMVAGEVRSCTITNDDNTLPPPPVPAVPEGITIEMWRETTEASP